MVFINLKLSNVLRNNYFSVASTRLNISQVLWSLDMPLIIACSMCKVVEFSFCLNLFGIFTLKTLSVDTVTVPFRIKIIGVTSANVFD